MSEARPLRLMSDGSPGAGDLGRGGLRQKRSAQFVHRPAGWLARGKRGVKLGQQSFRCSHRRRTPPVSVAGHCAPNLPALAPSDLGRHRVPGRDAPPERRVCGPERKDETLGNKRGWIVPSAGSGI